MKYRLAVLCSHPIQYQAPLFRRLAVHPEMEIIVYFCWDFGVAKEAFDPGFGRKIKWDVPLLEGYNYKFLANASPKPSASFLGQINPGITIELWRNKYDAVLVQGYSTVSSWMALTLDWLTRTPVIFRGETDLYYPRSDWKKVLKGVFLPPLLKKPKAFLFSYSANYHYYRHYGVPDEKLFFFPCAVDNGFWQGQARRIAPFRDQIKAEIGIPSESPVILYVGKLIPLKRPVDIIKAFEILYDNYDAWLVFVGDGSEKMTLIRYAEERKIQRVCFTGFKNQLELASFYAIADILVLSSNHDKSPKVLNEGMNFGLPVITTDRVITALDLVKHGENGYVYPVGKVGFLRDYLSRLLENRMLREEMGKQSLEIVSEWNFDRDANAIVEALDFIKNNGR